MTQAIDLRGQAAAVTGGGRDLGRAFALAPAALGRPCLLDRFQLRPHRAGDQGLTVIRR